MSPEPANNHSDPTDESDTHKLDIKAERALEQIAEILTEIALTAVSNESIPADDQGDCGSNKGIGPEKHHLFPG